MSTPTLPTREELTDFLKEKGILEQLKAFKISPEQRATIKNGLLVDRQGNIVARLTKENIEHFIDDPVGAILEQMKGMSDEITAMIEKEDKEREERRSIIQALRVFISTVEFHDAQDFIVFLRDKKINAMPTALDESYYLGDSPAEDFSITMFLNAAYADFIKGKSS